MVRVRRTRSRRTEAAGARDGDLNQAEVVRAGITIADEWATQQTDQLFEFGLDVFLDGLSVRLR